MKTSLLSLAVLFHLIYSCQGDCKAECLTCKNLYQQEQFNILVCNLECEGKVPSSLMWKNCRNIISVSPLLPLKLSTSQARSLPFGVARIFGTLGNTHDVLQAVKNMSPIRSTEDIYDDEAEVNSSPQDTVMPSDKRSYDFQAESLASKPNERSMKRNHDISNAVESKKSFQKRYGGFMGIRKSARNWSNLIRQTSQKRYSKFLRQYLGLTTRSTDDSLPGNLAA
ncbi:prepronociceptin b [Pristis pectinata]|uniref:prepronociceptin b n=1 Tax=Pristis pectinata TaxID=685728 RepID=UPI00223E8C97|nr:prepronociceptin b [Pristis pectinata]